jgi:hypothetical protein
VAGSIASVTTRSSPGHCNRFGWIPVAEEARICARALVYSPPWRSCGVNTVVSKPLFCCSPFITPFRTGVASKHQPVEFGYVKGNFLTAQRGSRSSLRASPVLSCFALAWSLSHSSNLDLHLASSPSAFLPDRKIFCGDCQPAKCEHAAVWFGRSSYLWLGDLVYPPGLCPRFGGRLGSSEHLRSR